MLAALGPHSQPAQNSLWLRCSSVGEIPEPGSAKSHDEHLTRMIDIMSLAFHTDRTRVATFMMGRSSSGIDFSFVDKKCGGLHGMAHHAGRKEKLEGYQIANEYCVKKYVEFLQKLHAIKDGERSLLDNSMIMFGNNMRDGNSHTSANLPSYWPAAPADRSVQDGISNTRRIRGCVICICRF